MGDLYDGERQVAPDVSGIRRDHRARYEWASRQLPRGSRVFDFACGVGYGASILAEAGMSVVGWDKSREAIAYARRHYAGGAQFDCATDVALDSMQPGSFDAVVCFETIEHLADPLPALKALRKVAPRLLCSVPNEDKFPFVINGKKPAFHHRHYTAREFACLLQEAGYSVTRWLGQGGPYSEVVEGMEGRTLVVDAVREEVVIEQKPAAPDHVAILGLGPSLNHYIEMAKRLGGKRKFCDETWAINALGDIIQCDRVFHMDDVRIQEIRAAALPESNIAAMLAWLRTHPGPVYTSRPHADYPGLVPFPLEDVINSCGIAYFNSTAAYAVALAVHIGVKQISMFGCDFTYPDAHDAEKGRGCVEFHLGIAKARGIMIGLPPRTTLMDAISPEAERIYGYDTLDLEFLQEEATGRVSLKATPRSELPSAAEIEERYDHSKHPSALVKS